MIFLTSYDREFNILKFRGTLMRTPTFALSRGISSAFVGFYVCYIYYATESSSKGNN